MPSSHRRFPRSNSLVVLGALVFVGAVITTVAGAAPPPGGSHSAGAAATAAFQPALDAGRLARGHRPQALGLRLDMGAPAMGAAPGARRALWSDTEHEQQRLGESLISMSLRGRW